MEINKLECNIPSVIKVSEIPCEQSVDTDFTLPDYYPEIDRILKVMPEANILSAQVTDNGVNVGGQVVLTMLYVGNDGQINSFTHIYPFVKNIEVSDSKDCFVNVTSRMNYLNTKATAPRKAEVHGSLTLAVVVSKINNCSVLSEIDCEGVYTKTNEISFSQPLNPIMKSAFVEDEIIIPEGKQTVGKILRSCAKACVSECKYVTSKIVIKGDIDIEILYCSPSSNKPVLLTERRGFSQIIDCDADCDDIKFDTVCHIDSLELHPKTSIDGEVRNIAFTVKVGLDIYPYCIKNLPVITSAFSGRYLSDIKTVSVAVENVVDSINENYVCKKSLDFSGVLAEVYDLWCTATVDYASDDGDDILVKGAVLINIVGANADNEPVLFERTVDYDYRYNVGHSLNGHRCRPDVSIEAVNYSMNSDGMIEVLAELNIKATVFEIEQVSAVAKISIDEGTLIKKDTDTAVLLYFAENETVWSIAEKYGTCPEKICQANGLESVDSVCNKTLLIPNIF